MNAIRVSGTRTKAGPVLMVLAAGVAIIALTVYAILSLTAPVRPESSGEVAPPQDNTPFVGKKW
ncbi:MAG TPA: hypothetical protein VG754_00615 [Verrucomicrobiae bacterium]|nr:hypothetical protein [Verrucomicrobiae bacterium]